jgi:hypothetical protein
LQSLQIRAPFDDLNFFSHFKHFLSTKKYEVVLAIGIHFRFFFGFASGGGRTTSSIIYLLAGFLTGFFATGFFAAGFFAGAALIAFFTVGFFTTGFLAAGFFAGVAMTHSKKKSCYLIRIDSKLDQRVSQEKIRGKTCHNQLSLKP